MRDSLLPRNNGEPGSTPHHYHVVGDSGGVPITYLMTPSPYGITDVVVPVTIEPLNELSLIRCNSLCIVVTRLRFLRYASVLRVIPYALFGYALPLPPPSFYLPAYRHCHVYTLTSRERFG